MAHHPPPFKSRPFPAFVGGWGVYNHSRTCRSFRCCRSRFTQRSFLAENRAHVVFVACVLTASRFIPVVHNTSNSLYATILRLGLMGNSLWAWQPDFQKLRHWDTLGIDHAAGKKLQPWHLLSCQFLPGFQILFALHVNPSSDDPDREMKWGLGLASRED